MTDEALIRVRGMRVLIDSLGLLDAQRFIMLTKSDKIDYTEWRQNLFEDMSLEDMREAAAEYARREKDNGRLAAAGV
jgi:hypothetical protein